jgi:PAC2 family
MALYTIHQRPSLTGEPVLVMCLDGWIDAGLGAATALAGLLASVESEVVATFDTDELLDHRARRPVVRIVDGLNTGLTWPELQLRAGRDAAGHHLLVLVGPEPDHRWRAFCDDAVELAVSLGTRLAVGLGAFPAPVPHTRPCRLASTATTEALAAQVGFVTGTLDVPAGVQAALERSFAEAGVPAIGLWARVPHYLAAMPYPEASATLLEGLSSLTGLQIDTTELREAAADTRRRVDELVANNPEHQQLVAQLEGAADAETGSGANGGFGNLPSGDEIAAELERFLRGER